MKKLAVWIFLVILCFVLSGAEENLRVTGIGKNVREATVNALSSALEQKYGLTLSTVEKSTISSAESFVAEESREKSTLSSRDSLVSRTASWSRRKIKSYREISRTFNPAQGKYSVVLEVIFPGRYIVGQDPANRRRMAVGKFFINRKQFSAYGQKHDARQWANLFLRCPQCPFDPEPQIHYAGSKI